MSAAEHQSRNASSQSGEKSLKNPPQRPSLLQPPPRPASPAPPSSEVQAAISQPAQHPVKTPAIAASAQVEAVSDPPKSSFKNHPIAPPSEPMQYRAIGLVRGVYEPSEEQLNRGNILADDGAVIDAVLLGRVTSLIKKHIDLESSHLWVVYPRTRQVNEEIDEETPEGSNGALHLQIVGVWEPETLGLPGENPHTGDQDDDESAAATESPTAPEASAKPDDEAESTDEQLSDNYFSIRGEVVNYDEEKGHILVKIVQGSKRSGKPPKAFKLNVVGEISGKTVGYFWELEVTRQGEELTLTEGRPVGIVPPKKKKKGKFLKPRRGGRHPGPEMDHKSARPIRTKEKPRIRPSAPVKSNPL